MRSRYFVILSLFILIFCIAAYPVVIDKVAIPDRTVARSYQQFLLMASKPIQNRIIISSGSNSTHSIATSLIEKHFGKLVINLADNGSYPLEHRIYNLSNYVSAGDLIIFPLELRYFTESKKLPGNYVKSIIDKIGSNSFYYRELPYYNKLDFIYNHIPFTLALKRVLIPNGLWLFNKRLRQNESDSITYIRASINKEHRGSLLINDPQGLERDRSDNITCDEYLFEGKIGRNFKISEQFKKNLVLLQKMGKDKGVKIIFTWPAVTGKTGNECYTSAGVKDNIYNYTQEIVAEVNRHGFSFLGSINDSRFDSTCFLNTYYHIKADCALVRTKNLIDLLEASGVTPATGYSTQETKKVLNSYLTRAELAFRTELTPPRVNVPVKSSNLTKNLLFTNGWSVQEKEGIWSTGKTSTIIIPKSVQIFNSIRFKGIYFNGNERTGLWINGEFIGRYVLTNQSIKVTNNISAGHYTKIVLEHSNPITPKELGINNDMRKIKYWLQSIELNQLTRYAVYLK